MEMTRRTWFAALLSPFVARLIPKAPPTPSAPAAIAAMQKLMWDTVRLQQRSGTIAQFHRKAIVMLNVENCINGIPPWAPRIVPTTGGKFRQWET